MSKIKVKNRSDSSTGYRIPDMNLARSFGPGETKEVDEIELQKLAYQDGGQELIDSYFQIIDKNIAAEISPNVSVEPEYWLTDEEVKDYILNKSLDEFLDCLDFAPSGTIELIKKYAISIPMVDTSKMDAFKKKFGFDIRAAIEFNKEQEVRATEARARRVQPQGQTSEYKVITRRIQE